MKRALTLLGILGIATVLAGCGRCGEPVKFFPGLFPAQSCTETTPQG